MTGKPVKNLILAHRRSRNACLQCKKRKVKCDEQAPCCHNCKYRHTACSFRTYSTNLSDPAARWAQKPIERALKPFPTDQANGHTNNKPLDEPYWQACDICPTPIFSSESSHSFPVAREASPFAGALQTLTCMPNLAPEEHELMHHYATTAFASLADYEVYRPIWQVTVPQEMQSVNFLKHGILAISALHIHHLHSRTTNQTGITTQELPHKQLAQKHYHAAIMEFGSLSPGDIRSNTSASFAFSHLTVFFAFGSSQLFGSGDTMPDAIGDLLGLFALTRKAMTFLKVEWDSLEKGNMGILLQRGPQITDRQYLSTDIITALELVEELCNEWVPPPRHLVGRRCHSQANDGGDDPKNTYRLAISQLWDSFVMIETKRKDWGMALRFPMIFPDALFPYFRAREPLAMVILAHYCVLLRRAPVRWWAEGWSTQVIQAIFRGLPENWRYAVSWPMSAAGLLPSDM